MNGGARDESNEQGGAFEGVNLLEILAPRVHTGQILFANAMRRAIYAAAPDQFSQLNFGDDGAFLDPHGIAAVSSGTPFRRSATPDGPERAQCGPVLLDRPVDVFEQAVFGSPRQLRGVQTSARRHGQTVAQAVRTIGSAWPRLSALIGETVRYLMVFEQADQNSFASRSTHGVAYLNVSLGSSLAFFVEDLAHQCGHVLFSSAWEGGEDLLLVDRDTEMASALGAVGDHRTLEVALHGAVTLALMLQALDCSIHNGLPRGECAEARARLVFALARLGLDLGPLAGCAVLSTEGAALLDAVADIYHRMLSRYRDDLMTSDFTGQGYNFDYTIYLAHNAPSAQDGMHEKEIPGVRHS